jgi:hypothetical protein
LITVYYGAYTEGGASVSKAPVDAEEPWVSRIDLDLIPPPLSVASLISSISKKEGITGSSQLFVEKGAMTPLSDDHILTDDGNWPGSSADEPVMFKFASRPPPPTFIEGGKYMIVNCATGRVVGLVPSYYGLHVASRCVHTAYTVKYFPTDFGHIG